MKKLFALALCAAIVVAVTVAGGAGAANNPQRSDTLTADCINATTNQKEGTFTYEGPVVVWPPNHKYRSATITLTDQDDETLMDNVTVAATGTHDQILDDGTEMNGSGNTDPATDVKPGAPGAGAGSASTTFEFRGERSGRDKTGRTYTFTATGTTDSGASTCKPVDFTALVPHDQRRAK